MANIRNPFIKVLDLIQGENKYKKTRVFFDFNKTYDSVYWGNSIENCYKFALHET